MIKLIKKILRLIFFGSMAALLDAKKIIKRIIAETGKSEDEIRKLIDEKKRKFAGLLTDDGAAFMLAKELGVDIQLKTEKPQVVKIANLVEGMRNVDIVARVLHVQSPKKFEKENRKGRYCKLLLADETGEITLTLWNKDIKWLEQNKVERGDTLLVKNCIVSSFNDRLNLSLGLNSELVVNPKDVDTSTLPKAESIALKIADLSEGMQNVDVFARVLRVFETRGFERNGEKAKVTSFEIGDGSATIRAVAWRELAERASKLYAGELIKIEGASVKSSANGLELHLDWRSRIISDPKTAFKIPELAELTGIKYKRRDIKELEEGMSNVEVVGEIVDINKGNLIYYFCPTCKEKASSETCEKCGNKARARAVVTVILDDGTASIACTLFGRQAEVALGISALQLLEEMQNKSTEQLLDELANAVVGKMLLVRGDVRRHSLNPEELELIAKDAMKPKLEAELANMLKSLAESSSGN